jgi:hypothetical protein
VTRRNGEKRFRRLRPSRKYAIHVYLENRSYYNNQSAPKEHKPVSGIFENAAKMSGNGNIETAPRASRKQNNVDGLV